MNRRWLAYLIATFAVIASAGVGLAAAFATSSMRTGPTATPGTAVPRLSDAARAAFGVFSQPPAKTQEVRIVGQLVQGDRSFAFDPSSVRLARDTNGMDVLVAGDSDSLCTVGRIPGKAVWGGCGPLWSATDLDVLDIATTGYPPGEPEHRGEKLAAFAVFPDGTSHVTVVEPDGDATSLPIVNNVVAFIAGADATVTWTGTDGLGHTSPLPH